MATVDHETQDRTQALRSRLIELIRAERFVPFLIVFEDGRAEAVRCSSEVGVFGQNLGLINPDRIGTKIVPLAQVARVVTADATPAGR